MRVQKLKSAQAHGVRDVPPGQVITEKFPVLSTGPTPHIDLVQWRLRLFGLVEKEMELTWEHFMALPQTTVTADFHCVSQWSSLDNTWQGVLFRDIAKLARSKPEACFVTIHCYGEYTTNLPLDTLLDGDVLFAHHHDGKPLEPNHGSPLRLVVPKRYAWKSAKWVSGVEFTPQDRPGFWEILGYNNNANPWKEERFCPNLV